MNPSALRAPSQSFLIQTSFLLVLAFGIVATLATPQLAEAQTVRTDYPDYSPGDAVLVTGTGWEPNETVSLHFDETPYQFVLITLYTVADAEGNISNYDYIIQDYHLGTAFVLTATGMSSGRIAQTTFTDNPKVGSVSVASQSSIPCAGGPAQATYVVTIVRGNINGSAGAFTADLTVPSGLPADVVASFSPNPVSFTPGAASRTATLTLTTSAATPPGTTMFGVKAATSASDTASTTASLTVSQPPAITSPGNLTASNAPGQCDATVSFAATATGSPSPTITYSKDPGTDFPVGVTTVTATATNACGSVSTTFTVTVNDTELPSIATAILTRSADAGVCGASIAALGTTASDNCSVSSLTGTRSDAAPLGAVFPVGITMITWTAQDAAGNSTTATQTVTVEDHENPVLTAPADLTVTTGAAATQCGAMVTDTALGTAVATDNCGATTSRAGVPAGNFFPVGTTTITYTATDPSGHQTTATQRVTVVDTTPPSITTANLSRSTDGGTCGASIADLATEAADNCAVSTLHGTRSDDAALDAAFPAGTTTISWVATDPSGNTATATQQITVVDNTPPAIQTAPITRANDLGACGATIADLGTSASDNCGIPTLNGARSDGAPLDAIFPVGTTTITWTATDAAGNSSTETQSVTVNDTEKPALAAPADLTITTGADATQCGATADDPALGTATATDNCSVSVTRDGIPAGHFFPVGTTTITYTATDASGNSTTATQLVTVLDTTPPAITTAALDVPTGEGLCNATIESLGTTAADQCGGTTLTGTRSDGAPLGDPFPVGTTTITWHAVDVAGNASSLTQTVKVSDVEIPTLALPAVVEQFTGAGATSCAALVSEEALGAPIASDNCGVTLTRTGVPEGNLFPIGTTTITYTATDPSGNSVTATQTVQVTDNTPPTLTAPADLTLGTGPGATGCGLTVAMAALGTATASDNCSVTVLRTGVPTGNLFLLGTTTITYIATDASGNTTTATQAVTILDQTPPTITTANLSVSTNEAVCSATIADLGTTAADNCGSLTPAGSRSDGAAIGAPFPKGTTTITWTATDAAGNTTTATQTVTVSNPAPQVTILTPTSGTIVAAGANLSVSGLFTDNAGDLHTARWACDALTVPATVNEATGAVGGTLCFAAAGVYKVTLEVADQCGNTGSASQVGGLEAMIVVYDPSAGFVTGGGWINSPAGSFAANPALVGKASFGFVSKYKKGQSAPTGETEFQFKAGNLNLHSSSYDWLVVAGSRAQFKGTGTINGAGTFGFLITATDGQTSGGGGMDKFRIKITDKATSLTVYDNQMGASDDAAPTTLLGGGSIAIQSSSGALSAALMGPGSLTEEASAPAATALFQNSPNPFNPATTIRFALRESGRVTLQVYGVHGELVRTIVDEWMPTGTHAATWNGTTRAGNRAASGVYYAVLQAGGLRDKMQMVLVK
jgi:hypothetical protein